MLIVDKLGQRKEEQGVVRESPQEPRPCLGKRPERARSGPLPPPRAGYNRQTGVDLTLERL